jgi:AhpD family alkylhydroperoxidase
MEGQRKIRSVEKFKKRKYENLGEFMRDTRGIFSHRKEIRELMRGDWISPPFRERLMLAVTSVNQCRYCSYAHSREALSKGVSPKEIDELLDGGIVSGPQEEIPALLYAQHWAERNGNPDADIRNRMADRYGEKKLDLIELAFRMIRMGNLLGNTLDYILFTITFGMLGR